jgi:hypothetical protein
MARGRSDEAGLSVEVPSDAFTPEELVEHEVTAGFAYQAPDRDSAEPPL